MGGELGEYKKPNGTIILETKEGKRKLRHTLTFYGLQRQALNARLSQQA